MVLKKKKTPGTMDSKEGHADSILAHGRTDFLQKCKHRFLLPSHLAKFLFIKWDLYTAVRLFLISYH